MDTNYQMEFDLNKLFEHKDQIKESINKIIKDTKKPKIDKNLLKNQLFIFCNENRSIRSIGELAAQKEDEFADSDVYETINRIGSMVD